MENDLHKDLEPHTTLRHGTEVSYEIENYLNYSTLWEDALIWIQAKQVVLIFMKHFLHVYTTLH